jgi:hypothetical protein
MGITGAANSMGARMGVGMGLAALSQVAPSEMQGALALGGTVGMFNPLAGLAVAGLGGMTQARSGLGGALAGAGGGAAVGTMIAGPAGAAVGAALGALGGAIFGSVNKLVQELKEARNAAQGAVDNLQLSALRDLGTRLYSNIKAVEEGQSTIGSISSITGFASSQRRKAKKSTDLVGGLLTKYRAPTQAEFDRLANFDTTLGTGDKAYGEAVRGSQIQSGVNISNVQAATGMTPAQVATLAKMGDKGAQQILQKYGNATQGGPTADITPKIGLKSRRGLQQKERLNKLGITDQMLFGQAGEIDVTQKEIEQMLNKAAASPLKAAFKQLFDQGLIDQAQLDAIKKQPVEAAKAFIKQQKVTEVANTAIERQTSARMNRLQKMTGKTNAELEAMAHSMGVNLFDPMVKFEDLVVQLGLTIVKTSAEMRQANTDVFVEAGNVFKDIIKQNKAVEVIDEASEAMRVALANGTAGSEDIIEFLDGIQAPLLQINKGDPLAAVEEMMYMLGTASNPGLAFSSGGVFAGIDPNEFFKGGTDEAIRKYGNTALSGFRTNAVGQIQSMLGAEGKFVDQAALETKLKSMTPEQQMALYRGLQNTSVTEGADGTKTYAFGGLGGTTGTAGSMGGALLDVLGLDEGLNLKDVFKPSEEILNNISNNFATWTPALQSSIIETNKKIGNLFTTMNDTPAWMKPDALKNAFKEAGLIKDTMTPRGSIVGDTTTSRLSQTMARHASIDGMLTGNRTITSSYRTYGLGSINSDHVTGRAIDLVGANLGQYKVMTERAGGFAEFHGRGGTRHLHVVPGSGFIGDTSVPMAKSAPITSAPFSSGSSVSNYNFYITGANASPEDIANRVMAKIQDQARAEMER